MGEARNIKVYVEDLKVGMYVSNLDRPWLETPFLFQGFILEEESQVEQLREYCQYVYVDELKCNVPLHKSRQSSANIVKKIESSSVITKRDSPKYKTTVPVETEVTVAKQVYKSVDGVINGIMDDVYSGKAIQVLSLKRSITPMIESVIRNPDALMWVAMIRKRDDYLYNHSLNASMLAVTVGRQIGLSKDELHDLAMGAMLFDIGKMKLPKELLQKPGKFSKEELLVTKKHVQFGVETLQGTQDINRNIMDMVKYHHERHDGSGYPYHLKGTDIPLFARIAAVVDCYDAITSIRPYAEPLSPYEAIIKLYEWRDVDFQSEIVEQFIQAIGLYPTGTLVEMTSGQVGVILAQNRVRRLKPRVMLVLDENKQSYGTFLVIDLIKEEVDNDGKPLEIMHALEPGSYDIDPEDFYL